MASEDEIIKTAKGLLSKVGGAVAKAGSAAKRAGQQVTGVGRGSVRIELERTRHAPGDDVRGKVTLALTEPVEAKRMIVTLRATQRTVDYHRAGGVRTVGTSQVTVYEQTCELGGPKRYESAVLSFAVPVPKDATDRKATAPGGTLGDVARAVSSVVAPTTGPIEWRLTASLVISFGRDLEHTVDLVVD